MGRGFLQARAALLGDFLFRAAVDAVVFPADGKAEGHGRRFLRRRVFAAHVGASAAVAAGTAVEGIAHGIEDGRLAGTRRPIDEEEFMVAQFAEVDDFLTGIGAKGLHF